MPKAALIVLWAVIAIPLVYLLSYGPALSLAARYSEGRILLRIYRPVPRVLQNEYFALWRRVDERVDWLRCE